jgi:hypothetical protein
MCWATALPSESAPALGARSRYLRERAGLSQEALGLDASDRASLLDFASGVRANSTDVDPPPLALVSSMSAGSQRQDRAALQRPR